jgi:hypothetical protein
VQTENQEAKKHPAELVQEELKMGLDHPSYYKPKKKKQNQGE